jgi:hypothetical protein
MSAVGTSDFPGTPSPSAAGRVANALDVCAAPMQTRLAMATTRRLGLDSPRFLSKCVRGWRGDLHRGMQGPPDTSNARCGLDARRVSGVL